MPEIEDKNETEDDEMDQDTADSEKTDDDDEEMGSGSDGEESSELDEEECERRRNECMDDMMELEKQFCELKEQLCQERILQVDLKLKEVQAGTAREYLAPLDELQENMRLHTQVAAILRELKIQNIKNEYEAEQQAAEQHYESEKILLYDQVKTDLEEKIRRLEEDRHNIDISSDLWNESQAATTKKNKKKNKFFSPDRRRKPVTVTGPYVVYMLKDVDIIEDWTAIKKALKQTQRKKEREYVFSDDDTVPTKADKFAFSARYDDGKLFYEGDWYSKGHHIIIDNKEDSPVHATVTAINTGEVWVKRADGNKSKLYIPQLQKGKYTIRPVNY